MTLPAGQKRFSPEEYLRQEADADSKHEYHAGLILAMSGGSYRHSRIISNLIRSVGNRLEGSPCFVLEGNMRVRIGQADRYVYPDASVVCGEPLFDPLDRNQTTIVNPRVVIEVLSDSTEAYDRGDKFSAYRDLESVKEYVLVSQNYPSVETFFRQGDGTWLFAAWQGLEAVAVARSVQISVPLTEIYAGVKFGDQANSDSPPE